MAAQFFKHIGSVDAGVLIAGPGIHCIAPRV